MKKTLFQKVLCIILSATTLLGVFAFSAFAASSGGYGTNRDTASSLEDMQSLVGVSTYEEYMAEKSEYKPVAGLGSIIIDVVEDRVEEKSNSQPVAESEECKNSMLNPATSQQWDNFGSDTEKTLYLPSSGSTTWEFYVPEGAGSFYYIKIEYYTCQTSESSISSVERKLYIDYETPFKEASYITLGKSWKFDYITENYLGNVSEENSSKVTYEFRKFTDEKTGAEREAYCKVVTTVNAGVKTEKVYSINQDINQNSMLPTVSQYSDWGVYYVQDSSGYYQDFFSFHIPDGNHFITLEAEREPVIIKSIELVPVDPNASSVNSNVGLPSYADVLKEYEKNNYTAPADGEITFIEAEFPDFVSDSAVYPTNDRPRRQRLPLSLTRRFITL